MTRPLVLTEQEMQDVAELALYRLLLDRVNERSAPWYSVACGRRP